MLPSLAMVKVINHVRTEMYHTLVKLMAELKQYQITHDTASQGVLDFAAINAIVDSYKVGDNFTFTTWSTTTVPDHWSVRMEVQLQLPSKGTMTLKEHAYTSIPLVNPHLTTIQINSLYSDLLTMYKLKENAEDNISYLTKLLV